jgi:hypothetical protein
MCNPNQTKTTCQKKYKGRVHYKKYKNVDDCLYGTWDINVDCLENVYTYVKQLIEDGNEITELFVDKNY